MNKSNKFNKVKKKLITISIIIFTSIVMWFGFFAIQCEHQAIHRAERIGLMIGHKLPKYQIDWLVHNSYTYSYTYTHIYNSYMVIWDIKFAGYHYKIKDSVLIYYEKEF